MNTKSVRPIIAPHYHYDNSHSHSQSEPIGHNMLRHTQQENRYDLVTGEYLHNRHNDNTNQTPLISNYLSERRSICCKCCEKKVPVNWLTISLFTCFILLIMFTIFQLVINSNPRKSEINSLLLQEVIWILSCAVIMLSVILIVRYLCSNCSLKKLCRKCVSDEEAADSDQNDSFNYYSGNYNEQFV